VAKIRSYSAEQVLDLIGTNRGLLLVHFGSPLASSSDFVCKELEILMDGFIGRVGFANVELPLQDIDLLRRYSIEEIPTLILFSGCVEVERLTQIFLPNELRDFLENCCSYHLRQNPSDG